MVNTMQAFNDAAARHGDDLLHIRTVGIDEMSKEFSRLVRMHDVTLTDRQRDFISELRYARLGRSMLSTAIVRASMDVKAFPVRDHCLVFGALVRPLDIRIGRRRTLIPVGRIAVIPPDVPFELYIPPGISSSMMLRFDMGLLETVLAEELHCDVHDSLQFIDGGPADEESERGYMDLLSFIQTSLQLNVPQCRSRTYLARLETLAVSALIRAKRNNYSSRLEAANDDSPPRFMKRAEDYIRTHAGDRLTLGAIAAVAAVSPRTLVRGFRKHRNCSPGDFLRAVRLERCREELLAGSPADLSVTAVAIKWGFTNIGRFAALYRDRYRENPVTTLRNCAQPLNPKAPNSWAPNQ